MLAHPLTLPQWRLNAAQAYKGSGRVGLDPPVTSEAPFQSTKRCTLRWPSVSKCQTVRALSVISTPIRSHGEPLVSLRRGTNRMIDRCGRRRQHSLLVPLAIFCNNRRRRSVSLSSRGSQWSQNSLKSLTKMSKSRLLTIRDLSGLWLKPRKPTTCSTMPSWGRRMQPLSVWNRINLLF